MYERVIGRDLCTLCGACLSLCPYLLSFEGRIVALNQCDLTQGRCFDYCPRTEVDIEVIHQKVFRHGYKDIEMGSFRRVFMSRATDKGFRDRAQNGGVVSTVMDFALKEDIIDAAVLTHRDVNHLPEGRVVRARGEVLACAGSSYVAGPTLESLNKKNWKETERIGIVGTPCQVLALAKMRDSALEKRTPIDQVSLVVGLFCTWAFTYDLFLAFLERRVGASQIYKLDITPPPERLLKVRTDSESLDIPLDEVRPFIRPTCGVCLDMTCELADISVGTVEGLEGWNTVAVRTERGEELFSLAEARGVVETRPLPKESLKHLRAASLGKKQRALLKLKDGGELGNGYLKLSPELIQRILSGVTEDDA